MKEDHDKSFDWSLEEAKWNEDVAHWADGGWSARVHDLGSNIVQWTVTHDGAECGSGVEKTFEAAQQAAEACVRKVRGT